MSDKTSHSSQDWRRLEELFHQAALLVPRDRAAFIESACGTDERLGQQLEEMLRADGATGGFDASTARPLDALLGSDALDPSAQPGTRVGAFELVRPIGSGGMGTVWLAKRADRHFDQRVAVKLIKRGMDTDDVIRRFRRERQVLANLEHPNIARLLDGGVTDDGRPYLAMEFIDGKPITDYCAERGVLVAERLGLFLDVCAAVQFAHQNLIVHRDLKPTNILVSSNGTPKLLDFGIAKILRPDPDGPETTASHQRLLTPRYASPEQVKNERVTTATDTYALGVILYELLTGEEPYQLTTRSRVEYERAICEQEPIRPSSVSSKRSASTDAGASARKSLSGDLDTIVLKALRKDPLQRYASVEQLTDDLERYLSGLPVRARPLTWRYRTGKFCARNKVAVLAGFTVAVALASASAVSVRFALREAEQRTLAEQRLVDAQTQQLIAQAINKFLNEDLLASVDPDRTPDPNITMRKVLDTASPKIGARFQNQPVVEASILSTLGATYESLGELGVAESHLTRAFEILVRTDGERSERAILARARLGNTQRLRSRLEEAEPLIRSAVELAQATLPATNSTTLYTRFVLGELHIDQGRLPEALEVVRAVASDYATLLGSDAPETLISLDSLAVVYANSGNYDDGEKLHVDLLARKSRVFGADSLAAISTLNSLAYVRMNIGRYDEAELNFRDALERSVRVLGEDHPTTLTTTDNLGLLCTQTARFEEAETLNRRAYDARVRTLGPNHGDTLTSSANIGFVFTNSGQWEKAESLYADLVPRVQRTKGLEHPFAITAQNNWAFSIWKLGRQEEAERQFREVVALRRKVLGGDHPETVGAISNLAAVLIDRKQYAQAEVLLEEAFAGAAKSLPPNHAIAGSIFHRRGLCSLEQGRLDAAQRDLDRAVEILTAALGPDHPRVAQVQASLLNLQERKQATEGMPAGAKSTRE